MRRLFHGMVALIGAILTLPVVLLVVLIIIACNRSNPFLLQERMGKDKRKFHVFKLRTLNSNGQTISVCGRFLRHFKIDELPQLWNVVLGNMALVGPRATIVGWAEEFGEKFDYLGYNARFEVLPGITGLAQIRGQSHDLPGNIEAIKSDLEFVSLVRENWLNHDAVILLMTLPYIFFKQASASTASADVAVEENSFPVLT